MIFFWTTSTDQPGYNTSPCDTYTYARKVETDHRADAAPPTVWANAGMTRKYIERCANEKLAG